MSEIPETLTKSYPENYPQDALDVLDTMSFTGGRSVKLLGSMSIRSQQYAGDYDAYEVVRLDFASDQKALNWLASRFKENIKALRSMKNVFIGDCKAGVIEEWRVIPRDAGVVDGKVVGYNAVASRRVVDELERAKVISAEEAAAANELLKPSPSPIEFLVAKGKIKFHLVRWSVPEILAGGKTLRDGRTYTLQEAFHSPTIAKLDVIGWVQNSRFTDFSMIYEFHNRDKALNPDEINIMQSLKENIIYYRAENNHFKALKRIFALAKFKGDNSTVRQLAPVFNSDLGRVYHILGDVGTLIALLEDHRAPLKNVRFEMDQFRNRMANVYTLPDFLSKETEMIGLLRAAIKSPRKNMMIARLKDVEARLQQILTKYSAPVINAITK